MKEGGFEAPKRKLEAQEGALASNVSHVLNGLRIELQKQRAIKSFREAHSDREVDLNSPEDRNEIMMEWVANGSAAKFAEEFGTNPDPEKLRQALLDINAPNMNVSKEETQH